MSKKLYRLFVIMLFALLLQPPGPVAEASMPATAASTQDEAPPHGIVLDELGIGSGYAWGLMKFTPGSLKVVPAYLRIGFSLNSLVGMQERNGKLQLALEPFANAVSSPDKGVEAGLDVFVRYLHPIHPSVKLVYEVGSGPVYFGIDTNEQGKSGFNFLNQFGLGTQVALSEKCAITLGYRFRHLSNAGLRTPNSGINSNMIAISVSKLY